MKLKFDFVNKVFSNNIFHFIILRYVGYILQFAISLLLAYRLSPYYFGIYGFITLVLQYLSYTHLGIPYELNVKLSIHGITNSQKTSYYFLDSLKRIFTINLAIILSLILFKLFQFKYFEQYNFNKYLVEVILISVFQNFNQLYINLYRTYGKLYEISIAQIAPATIQIIFILVSNSDNIITLLLIGQIIGIIITTVLFTRNSPIKLSLKRASFKTDFSWKESINLLTYNISYYLILISARTLVSIYFSVSVLGIYSFANTLANAVAMALSSVAFVFFSKMINKLNLNTNEPEKLKSSLEKSRIYYIALNYLVIFPTIIIFPYLIKFFPQYIGTIKVFQYLMLTQLLLNNTFGYTALLISNKKSKHLTQIGFVTIATTLAIGYLLKTYGVEFIAISTNVGVLIYNILVIIKGEQLLKNKISIKDISRKLFPRWNIAFIVLGIIYIESSSLIIGIIITTTIYILNYKTIHSLFHFAINKLQSNDFLKVT